MKKIIFSALAAFCMISANAQNEVSVVPFQVEPGTAKCELEVALKNNFEVHVLTYEVKLPVGFHVIKNNKGKYVVNTSYSYVDEGEIGWTGNPSVRVADGTEYLSVANACADDWVAIQDELGTIMKWNLSVDAGVAPGIYPLDINCRLIGNEDKTVVMKDQHYTSYVVVGNGTGSLKLDNIIPSDVNAALATEAAVTAVDLSGATAVNGTFTYVAGRDVVAPTATVAAKVKYVAPAPEKKLATLCLPTEATVNCWVYDRKEGDFAIFKTSDVAPANTPVLIEAAVATAAVDATVVGVAAKPITFGAYLAYNGEKPEIHTVTESATIPALRGYWTELAASNCRIAFEGPTGIQVIGTAADIENAYDLQGRQVQNAKNGVYVVNGKKQFVK